MSDYRNISEAFGEMVPQDEPIKGLQGLLRSTFLLGAAAAVRLLEDDRQTIEELREDLKCQTMPQ